MITITIEGHDAAHARREMIDLLGVHRVQIDGTVSPPESYEHYASARTVAEDSAREIEGEKSSNAETIVTNTPRVGESEEQTQARRGRGRPRKNPMTIDGESTLVSETTTPAEPEQIDLEEVIAAKSGAEMAAALPDDTEPEGNVCAGKLAEQIENSRFGRVSETQPADPEKGWTHDDAKTVARAMYVRLNSLQQHELDEKLHTNLQKFGVQRIKDLALEQIEAFVRAVEAEVA